MTMVLDEMENEARTAPMTLVLEVIETVSTLEGMVVTVHWVDGITAPITMVLELMESDPTGAVLLVMLIDEDPAALRT